MKSYTDSVHPRRTFIGKAAAAVAALIGIPAVSRAEDDSELDAWIHQLKGKHRQFFDATELKDTALRLAGSFLTIYEQDFGAKPGEANAVIGLHGAALAIGFTDSAWAKYGFGKANNVTDPATKESAIRNIFASGGDLGVDTLQKRGILFLMCNNTLRRTSGTLAAERGETFDQVYNDLKSSQLPGMILVPAMMVAINRAQENGITYARV